MRLMVIMMSMVTIFVVFLGIASVHGEAKDHFHAEGMSCKLALGIANFLLGWGMISRLWLLVYWLGSLVSWFGCTILGVQTEDLFQTTSMDRRWVSQGLLVGWMHCHHVMMMRLDQVVVFMMRGHFDSGYRSMMSTLVINMTMRGVMGHNRVGRAMLQAMQLVVLIVNFCVVSMGSSAMGDMRILGSKIDMVGGVTSKVKAGVGLVVRGMVGFMVDWCMMDRLMVNRWVVGQHVGFVYGRNNLEVCRHVVRRNQRFMVQCG